MKFPYFGEINSTNLVIWQKVPIFQSKFAKFEQFRKPKTQPGYPGFLKSKPKTRYFKTRPGFAITTSLYTYMCNLQKLDMNLLFPPENNQVFKLAQNKLDYALSFEKFGQNFVLKNYILWVVILFFLFSFLSKLKPTL